MTTMRVPSRPLESSTTSEDRDYVRTVKMAPRQYAVFQELIKDGPDNPVIAKRLFVSIDTVKTHVARILRATDCHTRAEVVARWYQGQIDVTPSRTCYNPLPLSYDEWRRESQRGNP